MQLQGLPSHDKRYLRRRANWARKAGENVSWLCKGHLYLIPGEEYLCEKGVEMIDNIQGPVVQKTISLNLD